ncbi:mRNA cap guanine-N7 methyltransferase [Elasticomyces elasticus]|nr:mRNA cap guanine-N7 methyltransferase [Elasticomyces elasticus]KAK4975724.1 hypothetical protein LTR28_008686 [Elasticomyces elasticus]
MDEQALKTSSPNYDSKLPLSRKRSISPSSHSPPRKRPGKSSRITVQARQDAERLRKQREEESRKELSNRPSSDVVAAHYNAVPERGRDWRRTDSQIKGLRNFNNWVKSTLIQRYARNDEMPNSSLLVLDIGCGKGGDLGKWQKSPQRIELYVGVDPADVSINQARGRYQDMRSKQRRHMPSLFDAHFIAADAFGPALRAIPIVQEVGLDPSIGSEGANMGVRPGNGGFDVVSMMFCLHYSFETEAKARAMLQNVASALKKGGKFLGVMPNSDIITEHVIAHGVPQQPVTDDGDDDWDPEKSLDDPPAISAPKAPSQSESTTSPEVVGEAAGSLEWGNSIYKVKFPTRKLPVDGVFRPKFGWKYYYFLEEAVETVPEYVVPWEGLRALAEEYNLELLYRKPFNEVWEEEKDSPEMGLLSERMGVKDRSGRLLVSKEEMEAASFYHAFCFYKV